MKCEKDHKPNSYGAATAGNYSCTITRLVVGLLAVFSETMKPS